MQLVPYSVPLNKESWDTPLVQLLNDLNERNLANFVISVIGGSAGQGIPTAVLRLSEQQVLGLKSGAQFRRREAA